MSDAARATDRINEALAEELAKSQEEVERLRALLERPITVQSPDAGTLKRIGEYLPKIGELAANTATIAGQMMQDRKQRDSDNGAILAALTKQDHTLGRIASALERAFPKEE